MAAVPSIGRAREIEPPSFALEARLTERLYERHHRRVFGFCLYQLRDRDDAADAAQTTFLYALGALRRGVVPSFEVPWLLAIARNVCRSRWDAGRRRGKVEFAHDPHRLAEVAPGREPTDELLGLDKALAGLSEPQRRAVLLRDWQGLSYQEVATELDVSVSAAETLIFRGRQALARALNGDAIEDGPRKRSFGLGSLLGALKSGLVGGSIAAKVAVGTAVIGLGVTAGSSIVDRQSARPSVSPSSSLPDQPQATGLARRAPAARQPGSVRASAHGRSTVRALRRATVPAAPTGETTTAGTSSVPVRVPDPVPAPAPGSPAGEPTTTMPRSDAPPADGQPSSSPVVALPDPAAGTTEDLVTNAGTITAPVLTTAVDTVQTVVTTADPVVTTVVGATQPVVDLASPIVNAITAPVKPAATLPVIPQVPIPRVHLP